MRNFLVGAQILVSISLVIVILLQAKGKGFGRGSAQTFTRRGAEKLVFKLTFVLTGLFILFAILLVAVN